MHSPTYCRICTVTLKIQKTPPDPSAKYDAILDRRWRPIKRSAAGAPQSAEARWYVAGAAAGQPGKNRRVSAAATAVRLRIYSTMSPSLFGENEFDFLCSYYREKDDDEWGE